MTIRLQTVGLIGALLLVLAALGLWLFIYLGVYNVSASQQHTGPVYRMLDYAMSRSLSARTGGVAVPPLGEEQRIRAGASHYRDHCLQCHGAPGVSPHALAFGMAPAPVNLVSTAREWPPAKVFWVVKHGLKMTGMPAWEHRMSDEDIWDIVAFVMVMPSMAPVEYADFARTLPRHHGKPEASAGTGHAGGHAASHGAATAGTATATASATPPGASAAPSRVNVTAGQVGDVQAGRRAISHYLCATCHAIPGIVGASRHVGPPLGGIATRKYIAGIVPNNPENMVRWLKDPAQLDPLTAMPALGLTDRHARDIAAYLYTLDDVR